MALPTYIDLVNDILIRLREPEVSSVNENFLSKMLGRLVNDSKRQVEDSYSWNTLTDTLVVEAVEGTYGYTLNGSGARFKVIDVHDIVNKTILKPVSSTKMSEMLLLNKGAGKPVFYNFNGVHTTTGDSQVDIFPVPEVGTTLYFNVYIPQPDLVNDGDVMWVPKEPVILGALARALVERGEDGGLSSSEAYALAKQSLADHIATESSRFIEEAAWEAV